MLAEKLLETLPRSIRILRKFSAQGIGSALSFQQLRILSLINEGQGQTQIAETLQVSMAATSKVINYLHEQKLIIRKSGEDRRTQILSLTPKGKQLMNKVISFVRSKLDIGIQELSRTERDELFQGLAILDKLIQKVKEV